MPPTSAVTEAEEAAAWIAAARTSAVQRGGRGEGVVVGVGVQADDGVEVDHAARLVLSDLDEAEADQGAQFLLRDAHHAGEVPGQVGDEAAPQVTGAGVEHDRGFVVVAVGAHRPAEPRVVLGVAGRAGDVTAVRAGALGGVAAGAAGQHLAVTSRREWTGPNEGAVKVANTHGCSATDSGMPLPPIRPERTSWRASRL